MLFKWDKFIWFQTTLLQSFYFKTTHGSMKMLSYTAGGLKIKLNSTQNHTFGTKLVVL